MSQSDPIDDGFIIMLILVGGSALLFGGVGSFFGACEMLIHRMWNGFYVFSQFLIGLGSLGMMAAAVVGLKYDRFGHWKSEIILISKLSVVFLILGFLLMGFVENIIGLPACSRGVVGYTIDSIRSLI